MTGKGERMNDTVSLDKDQLRLLIALQYLNASEWIFEGLKQQHEKNVFHFASRSAALSSTHGAECGSCVGLTRKS